MTTNKLNMKTVPHRNRTASRLKNVLAVLIVQCTMSVSATLSQGVPDPPPIGDSLPSLPQIAGDRGPSPRVPTGTADPTSGLAPNGPIDGIGTGVGRDRTVVYIYFENRMVRALRPDQLSALDLGKVQGLFPGYNLLGGQQTLYINASEDQLAELDDILAPYPEITNRGSAPGRNFWRTKPNLTSYETLTANAPLVSVHNFCRWLVILGVVIATIFFAFAAFSVVLGHRDGAGRVVGSASGLMALLMAYTLWKIVHMNTHHTNSTDNFNSATNFNRPETAIVNDANITPVNLPLTPPTLPTNGRSGIPVQPLSGSTGP